MVTVYGANNNKYKGLSGDTMPTQCRNGDRFIEIDGDGVFLYDEQNHQWLLFTTQSDPTSSLVGFGRVGYMVIE